MNDLVTKTSVMKRQLFFLLCGMLYFLSKPEAQSIDTGRIIHAKHFFSAVEPLEITLTSDFKKLRLQKKKDVYQPAYFTVRLSSNEIVSDSVRIYARGEFRRQHCQMPSLMISFKGKKNAVLKGLKKLKMVCGCSSSANDERLVLMEYLAYKIYNLLTDMSFQVRLVQMNYQDVNNKIKPYTQYAFFIEDVDDMAARNNCKEYQKAARALYSNRYQTSMMTMYQYMIGNLDWSIPNYHNIKLIQPLNDSTAYPYIVPYDFDFSGLVNAPYAFPNQEMFAVENVTDRFYRGQPRTPEEIEVLLQIYKSKKEKIIALIQNFETLNENDRKTMVNYIEDFYKTINNPKLVEHHFVKGKSR